jgi:hypothetical protein
MRRFYGVSVSKNGAPLANFGPLDADGMNNLLTMWQADQRDLTAIMVVVEAVSYSDSPQALQSVQVFDKRDRDPKVGETDAVIWTAIAE